MGFNKLTTRVLGKPLLGHTLAAFEACPAIRSIVVVYGREAELEIREIAEASPKIRACAAGGDARQESVRNGLRAVPVESRWVAVHDGARPLATPDLITRCVAAAVRHGAATAAEPVTDTLQRGDDEGRCREVVSRERLWRMQTPQVFGRLALIEAFEAVEADQARVTDETSVWQRSGREVFVVENTDWNFKVTYPRDVAVAEFILQSRATESLT
jgi:2-C-methyl-D-erythritol 4-phosphate cytidylyltransferase